ncbi:hypothetical protein E0H75_34275 [Kribbella capetownensis]|uniref:Uncharacterized protein n=1 Tax=Kribbella capetownensis TaxID=1572659 RepID=A0A4V2M6Q5_9ACTN|nr:hypothetical protein [Kribbella capetownensis]TCC44632.1 hypothetical protein E0H75_34275 [Kribbella capetownensis]
MKFPREKRDARAVVKPPPEASQRVDGGGPWGPTQFDLPERTGSNSQAILIVALVGVVVLLVIAGLWTLAYFKFT